MTEFFRHSRGTLTFYTTSNGIEFPESINELSGEPCPCVCDPHSPWVCFHEDLACIAATFVTNVRRYRSCEGVATFARAPLVPEATTIAFALRRDSASYDYELYSQGLRSCGSLGKLASSAGGQELTADIVTDLLRHHIVNNEADASTEVATLIEHLHAVLEMANDQRPAKLFHVNPSKARYTSRSYNLFKRGIVELLRASEGWSTGHGSGESFVGGDGYTEGPDFPSTDHEVGHSAP